MAVFFVKFGAFDLARAANSKVNSGAAQLTFTASMAAVLLVTLLVLILYIWEPLPLGLISLSIPVALVSLEPWTGISLRQALSGFANNATITVLSMFVISKGIQNSGVVQFLGSKIESFTGDNAQKQVGVISGLTGSASGAMNNTPVVAAFIPMVTNLARRTKVSPSKLLIPLSYAAMMGGTLTLLGTSTNILASDISARLIDHPFGMFEFTKLGIIVLAVGILYLVTIGYKLIPGRIKLKDELIEEYNLKKYFKKIRIESGSPLIGQTIDETFKQKDAHIDVVRFIRKKQKFMEPLDVKTLSAGDQLIVRADENILSGFIEGKDITELPVNITQDDLEYPDKGQEVIELVVTDVSFLVGKTVNESHFLNRYDSSLLAIRHGEIIKKNNLKNFQIRTGDVLLLLVNEQVLARLKSRENNFIVGRVKEEEVDYKKFNVISSLVIIMSVIILGSMRIVPISIAALGGVIAMVATENVKADIAYESIDWNIIFLLAGLIPLGVAMEQTGAARYVAVQLINKIDIFPSIIILAIFYLFTAMLTSLISASASAVLMIPVAVEVAHQLGANPIAFILAVTFAASTSFITPVGNQTSLMVYGPGGYKFHDYFLAGAPLLLIFTTVIPFFISLFWGI